MTQFTTRPEITGTFGVVTSTHWIATAVGMAILEKGGNAFDAAVATGFVLQIVEPHLNGPAGDLPAIIHSAKTGKTQVICAQGPAPAGATIEHYRAEGIDLIPGNGLLSTVIPGAFDGWMLMLQEHGTMSVAEVLAPAIHYARHGHPMLPRVADSIAGRVLIIEDEPIIAMDLENLVGDLGHRITGIARTRDEAVKLGSADKPDLILADIRLADNSSGIDAVNDLLGQFGNLPVIFITAYPERLLTGERPEPAFLISKPYKEDQVKSAVSQAMFFSTTASLKV